MTAQRRDKTRSSSCSKCQRCSASLERLGLDYKNWDYMIGLAGNPNTGKSTVFNALTGLRQHTGNWPGKTVARAEGAFVFENKRYKLIDLPGTYSLLSASTDEEIARNFILFGQPDCTVIVVDATCVERNLNLVLQVLEITDKAVIALNLVDEASSKGITVDDRCLARELGVPVVPMVAKSSAGLTDLLSAVSDVITGKVITRPHRVKSEGELQAAVSELVPMIQKLYPGLPNSRWVAMRLLDGDGRIRGALMNGELLEVANEVRKPRDGKMTELEMKSTVQK